MTLARKSINTTLPLVIALSGAASLSWEIIWQLKATLALGISNWATAITLAIMMGGLGAGSLLMGQNNHRFLHMNAYKLYGLMEICAGICGLLLTPAFYLLELIDAATYQISPSTLPLTQSIGILFLLTIPAACMGATFPLFSMISNKVNAPLAKLYSYNTLGAAIGTLAIAFCLIPELGVTKSIYTISAINILIGGYLFLLAPPIDQTQSITNTSHILDTSNVPSKKIYFVIFATGFATFTLEVAWFRSLSNIFPNTTDLFATLLACVLIAIALAAKDMAKNNDHASPPYKQLCLAAILICLITPVMERFDIIYAFSKQSAYLNNLLNHATNRPIDLSPQNAGILSPNMRVSWLATTIYAFLICLRMLVIYLLIAPAIRLTSTAFPWFVNQQSDSKSNGTLYAINTFAAITGSLITAWALLPTIGFAKTALLASAIILLAGVLVAPNKTKWIYASFGIAALLISSAFNSHIGDKRVQGFFASDENGEYGKVLASYEGPQNTTSVIEFTDKSRVLLINSSGASQEAGTKPDPSIHYMAWMGHLPMLLHKNPQTALVICFGTGQTANAVRNENPSELDIVDVNANIFKVAHLFKSNHGVLKDKRVTSIVMDGRAYLRRSKKSYDVITLEPMPPTNIGVNALYSREFYQLAKKRLNPNGIIAQWLPLHNVSPKFAASIARTFLDSFPNAILWLDKESSTGILLGSRSSETTPGEKWPGIQRHITKRNLNPNQITQRVVLNTRQLKDYSKYGEIITDDNQLLAYGQALYTPYVMLQSNLQLIQNIKARTATL